MLIVCPSCTTTYQVKPASLGASGRSVRCARCRAVWFAAPVLDVPAGAGAEPGAKAPQGSAEAPGFWRPAEDWDASSPWGEARAGAAATPPGSSAEDASDPVASGDDTSAPGKTPGPAGAIAMVDAPSLVPTASEEARGPEEGSDHRAAEAAGHEDFTARRLRLRAKRWQARRSGRLAVVIAGLLAVEAGLIAWRTEVAALLPQTASLFAAVGLPVNVRGLVFEAVESVKEVQDGGTILVVKGTIANRVRKALEVPRLRFALRAEDGHEIYAWTALPRREVLNPGETLPFGSRLASPPPEGHDVVVRFFNRRDTPATVR
jgi:predicted Zn finger-like uncharacterized protein